MEYRSASGAGAFAIGAAGSITGAITATGGTVSYATRTGAATFDLANTSGASTGIGTTWSGITTVTGSGNTDTMKGGAVTFTLDDAVANKGSEIGGAWCRDGELTSGGAGTFAMGAAGRITWAKPGEGGTGEY